MEFPTLCPIFLNKLWHGTFAEDLNDTPCKHFKGAYYHTVVAVISKFENLEFGKVILAA